MFFSYSQLIIKLPTGRSVFLDIGVHISNHSYVNFSHPESYFLLRESYILLLGDINLTTKRRLSTGLLQERRSSQICVSIYVSLVVQWSGRHIFDVSLVSHAPKWLDLWIFKVYSPSPLLFQ